MRSVSAGKGCHAKTAGMDFELIDIVVITILLFLKPQGCKAF